MIYGIDGKALTEAYGMNGIQINEAYDAPGNRIWNADAEPESNLLTVMTFNIGEMQGRNTNAVLSHILDTYHADIIGLQEVYKASLPNAFDTVFADYRYRAFANQVNKTAIVSKLALDDATSGIFVSQTIEQRGYNKTYINANGKRICWLNAHLETTQGGVAKANQAKELYDIARQETYFIITGDFNTICRSVSDTEYTTIMRQFLDLGCHSANCSEQFGFENTWSGDTSLSSSNSYPCDHIITSHNLPIKQVVFDKYKTTITSSATIDHIPIIAYVEV